MGVGVGVGVGGSTGGPIKGGCGGVVGVGVGVVGVGVGVVGVGVGVALQLGSQQTMELLPMIDDQPGGQAVCQPGTHMGMASLHDAGS